MQVRAKKRTFDDPGVLRLKESGWTTWHLFAPQFHQGRLGATERKPRVQADPDELAKALAELGG
jgi:hypothetical protein